MYERFYHLDLDPFRLSPDPRFRYLHPSFAKARAYMEFAFNKAEGFVVITGRPGVGKTTLIGDLVEILPRSRVEIGTMVTTRLEDEDLLQMVAHAFGLNAPVRSKSALLQYLTGRFSRELGRGRRTLLIIDEAQNLAKEALEELRMLTNLQRDGQPLLQIFLVGQESLQDLIGSPGMEQVAQRVVAACHLEPLDETQTREYVRHRLSQAGWRGDPRISESLYPIIHRFSEGIPRRINLFCGRLLLLGVVERKHSLGVADGRAVVQELFNERLTTLSPQGDALFDAPDRFEEPPPEETAANPPPQVPMSESTNGEIRPAPRPPTAFEEANEPADDQAAQAPGAAASETSPHQSAETPSDEEPMPPWEPIDFRPGAAPPKRRWWPWLLLLVVALGAGLVYYHGLWSEIYEWAKTTVDDLLHYQGR